MKKIQHIFISTLSLVITFAISAFVVSQAQAGLCNYNLSQSGCTITYDGTGFSSSDDSYCSQFAGEVEYAADGTVCATSPNSCDDSTCTAVNTITKCQSGMCSNSQTVPHPWSVCPNSSYLTCAPTTTPTNAPTPTPTNTPPPTIYVPPPTVFIPPPTITICPVPNQVLNVVVTCPFCL